MKVFQKLFFLIAMSLLAFSCGGNANNESAVAEKPAPAEETVKAQVAPVAKEEGPKELPGGITVESTTKTEEAPVDDANVDYKKLAASICNCGSKHKGADDGKAGDVHVNASDTEYQKEVDCAIAAKNSMTKGDISRQDLVSAIKSECHDIPAKFVMRIMMTLAK